MSEYQPGLEGVAATKSSISYLDGKQGILTYRGYPIVERWYHNHRVGYYELMGAGLGMDATVYSPLVDLKFTNDRPYPLLIETEIEEGGIELEGGHGALGVPGHGGEIFELRRRTVLVELVEARGVRRVDRVVGCPAAGHQRVGD